MDLEDWELLPDDGFLEVHDDGGKMIFSRKYRTDQKSVFRMNYFSSPNSPKSAEKPENSRVPKQLVPVPIFQLEPTVNRAQDHQVPIEIKLVLPSMTCDQITAAANIAAAAAAVEADQDMVSQVFFKKENEFVDMKMDSPRSGSRGITPQIDVGAFQFEDKDQDMKAEKEMVIKKSNLESHTEEEDNSGGLNMWKWSLSGIGAICSFGVAAATICIIVFGGSQRDKHHPKNHKLRFQIYTDDKRTKFTEAISVVRGVPLPRAQITCGGYYDGL